MDSGGSSFHLEEKSPDKLCMGNSRLSDFNVTLPLKSPTSESDCGVLDQQISSDIECDPDDIEELPSSNQIIPSGLETLVNAREVAEDVSWTSSMATPYSKNVTYSNLNTDERRVFLPSDNCATTGKRRALFTPDWNDSSVLRSDGTETPRIERSSKSGVGRSLLARQLDNSFRSQQGSFSCFTPNKKVEEIGEEQSTKRKSSEAVSPVVSKKRLKMQKNRSRNKVIGSPESKSADCLDESFTSVDLFNDSEEDIFSEFDNASSTPSRGTSEKGGSCAESTVTTSKFCASSISVEECSSSKNEDSAVVQNTIVSETLNESIKSDKTVVERPPNAEWSPDDSFSEAMVKALTSFQDPPVSELKSRVQSIKKTSPKLSLLYEETDRPLLKCSTSAEDVLKAMALQGKYSDSQPCTSSTLTKAVQQELVPFSQLETKEIVVNVQSEQFPPRSDPLCSVSGRCSSNIDFIFNKPQVQQSCSVKVAGKVTSLDECLEKKDTCDKTVTPPDETSILTDQQLILAGEEAEMLLLLENEDDWLCSKLNQCTDNNPSVKDCQPATTTVPEKDIPERSEDGFKTANGRNVIISPGTLKKASELFADIDNIEEQKEENENRGISIGSTEVTAGSSDGFSFASGKKVFISQGALRKAERILAEVDKTIQSCAECGSTDTFAIEATISSVAFKTGNGHNISVSQEALNKVSKLFAEEDEKAEDDRMNLAGRGSQSKKKRKFESLSEENVGFAATASGKADAVSEAAFTRAKQLFNDEENQVASKKIRSMTSENENDTEDGVTMAKKSEQDAAENGFSTASENSSGEDLATYLRLASKDSSELLPPVSTCVPEEKGKTVTISESALDLFKDDDISKGDLSQLSTRTRNERTATKVSTGEVSVPEGAISAAAGGFATASGKKVTISKDALEKARRLFADKDLSEEDLSELKTRTRNRKTVAKVSPGKVVELEDATSATLGGFATASGKKVTISTSALEKAKKLFTDEDTTVEDLSKLAAESRSRRSTAATSPAKPFQSQRWPSTGTGFATASGKKVAISESALEKAKTLFADEDTTVGDLSTLSAKSRNRRVFEPTSLATASGKTVEISKSALEKVKNLFADEDLANAVVGIPKVEFSEDTWNMDVCMGDGGDGNKIESSSSVAELETVGFATASGRRVTVSEDSLQKARMLFKNVEDENSDVTSPFYVTSQSKSLSPSVGANSTVKKRKVFRPVENDAFKVPFSVKKPSLKNVDASPSDGFSTASGKTVDVSEAALRKAKALFEETDNDIIKEKVEGKTERNGFSTASGHFVGVSEESLKKTKHIFEEDDNAEDYLVSYKLNRSQTTKKPISPIKPEGPVRTISATVLPESALADKMMHPPEDKTTNKSLSQEILESTAAFLADESENSIAFPSSRLIESVTSEPFGPEDRINGSEPVTCFPQDCSPIAPPGSPILGERSSTFQRKFQRRAKAGGRRLSLSMNLLSGKSSTPRLTKKDRLATNTSLPVSLNVELQASARKDWENEEDDEMLTKLEIDDVISEVSRIKEEEEQLGTGRELRPEVSEARKRAAEEQEKVVKAGIAGKKGPKMAKGSLFAKKTSSNIRHSWKSFVGMRAPGPVNRDELRRLGIGQWVLDVKSENAADFRFNAWNYYSGDVCRENVFGLPVGDGARLILNDEGTVGVTEVERAFLASASVDPALVPLGWVRNHYRWIVWKLASLERRFPKQFARVLSPHVVMQQLKYRYDREIDRCQRPAIRKILEHDDTPARRMVTCVASIRKIDGESGASHIELELTDSWYSIFALIDNELQSRVMKNYCAVPKEPINGVFRFSSQPFFQYFDLCDFFYMDGENLLSIN